MNQAHKNHNSQEWFGHMDAQKSYFYQAPPQDVQFQGQTIELKTYSQLTGQSKRNLYDRCTLLRDKLGADRLPPLNAACDRDTLIRWLLEVEVALANHCTRQEFTFADFGVPADYEMERPNDEARNRKAMEYRATGGLQGAAPFAADYSDSTPRYRNNSAVQHLHPQRDVENVNLPQWARERHVTENRGSFCGGGLLASMMQAQIDSMAGADVARRRNQASSVFG